MPTGEDVRRFALSLDGVREIDHWGRPAFRTKKRIFAVIRPDGVWLYLPDERKEFLFEADPATFVKFMWGKHPELIVQPARISARELKALLREAYEAALPPTKNSATKSRARTPKRKRASGP